MRADCTFTGDGTILSRWRGLALKMKVQGIPCVPDLLLVVGTMLGFLKFKRSKGSV